MQKDMSRQTPASRVFSECEKNPFPQVHRNRILSIRNISYDHLLEERLEEARKNIEENKERTRSQSSERSSPASTIRKPGSRAQSVTNEREDLSLEASKALDETITAKWHKYNGPYEPPAESNADPRHAVSMGRRQNPLRKRADSYEATHSFRLNHNGAHLGPSQNTKFANQNHAPSRMGGLEGTTDGLIYQSPSVRNFRTKPIEQKQVPGHTSCLYKGAFSAHDINPNGPNRRFTTGWDFTTQIGMQIKEAKRKREIENMKLWSMGCRRHRNKQRRMREADIECFRIGVYHA